MASMTRRILHLAITLCLIAFLVSTLLILFEFVAEEYPVVAEGRRRELTGLPKRFNLSLKAQPLVVKETIPLFNVTNAVYSRYLRLMTADFYDGEKWSFRQYSEAVQYKGERLSFQVKGYVYYQKSRVKITPIRLIEGFLPTSLYTERVELSSELTYYPESNVFYIREPINQTYEFSTIHFYFTPEKLKSAEVLEDRRYLQLSEKLTERTRELALNITMGLESPYEKVKALENYLRVNYEYNEDYRFAPPNWEPNDWFLFEEKRGVCINFNSALAILARCLGIPARLALGFLIDPTIEQQTVKTNQTHAWVEVCFKDIGWIPFDATPYGRPEARLGEEDGERIPTITRISSISRRELTRESVFNVNGTVFSIDGTPINGVKVVVYLARGVGVENISRPWLKTGEDTIYPVGLGEAYNGVFNITCKVSREVEVGYYSVIAHSLGKGEYKPSEGISKAKVKVVSLTRILVSSPRRVIPKRRFQVSGVLIDDEGNLLPHQRIQVYLDHKPLTIRYTDTHGTFRISLSLNEGTHKVDLVYPAEGNTELVIHPPTTHKPLLFHSRTDFYRPSRETLLLEAREVDIQPYTNKVFVRGVTHQVWGKIYFGKEPLENQRIHIKIGELIDLETTTDSAGIFNTTCVLEPYSKLGEYKIVYNLTEFNYSETEEVVLKARTKLKVESPDEVAPREIFTVNVVLTDEQGYGVRRASIEVQGRQKTIKNGISRFAITAPEDEGDYVIKASFNGSTFYLPSSCVVKVHVKHKTPLTYYMIPLVIAGFMVSLLVLRHRGFPEPKKSCGEKDHIAETVSHPTGEIKTTLILSLPDLTDLPGICGVGDNIRIKATLLDENGKELYDKKVKVFVRRHVNGEFEFLDEVLTGLRDECRYSFREKGCFEIVGEFKGDEKYCPSTSKQEVRVVDYREEIINGYLKLLHTLRSEGLEVPSNATVREISEFLMNEALWMVPKTVLKKLTELFELARYSNHLITRREYRLASTLMEYTVRGVIVRW
ncbi:hypothetical protein J7L06_09255 [Candidatus Bathyarchaeota archaeon]|nr:hypothetical protein [Candidatus Bathyarchaeota archaeon]